MCVCVCAIIEYNRIVDRCSKYAGIYNYIDYYIIIVYIRVISLVDMYIYVYKL